jgi:hypothetical protein
VLTSTDVIDTDIKRLSAIMPNEAWPATFIDLNAARNFVGQWCYENRFRYTGWSDVELRKYRLFVNFNAAKYALSAGVFEVERAVPPLNKIAAKETVVKEKDEVEVLKMRASVAKLTDHTPVGHAARTEHTKNVDDLEPDRDTSRASASPSVPTFIPEMTPAESAPLTAAMTEPEKEDSAPVDPFNVNTPFSSPSRLLLTLCLGLGR